MKHSVVSWFAAVGCVAISCGGALLDDQTRDVTVVVSVKDEAGAPIENVPLAISRKSGLTFGKTDSQGNWSLVVRIAADSQQELVKVTSESLIAQGPDASDATSRRIREIKDLYAVPSTVLISTATVQQQYDLTMVLPSAVHVSMMVSNGTSPLRAAVVVAGRDSVGATAVDGSVRVGGVVKGQDCTLFVREANTSGTRAIDVPASQLQADVDIGAKVVKFPAATCECTFSVTHRELLKRDPLPTKLYLTAVSTNGSDLYAFPIDDAGVCVDTFVSDRKVRLPAGEYYLVPGNAGTGRYAGATRKLLMDGRAADLQTAKVPRVVIAAEQATCEATVDMEAVRAAVASLAGLPY